MTEEQLLTILRKNENSHIPGSLHQQAEQELRLRDRETALKTPHIVAVGGAGGGGGAGAGGGAGGAGGSVFFNQIQDSKVELSNQVHAPISSPEQKNKWWEKTSVQLVMLLAAIVGIALLIIEFAPNK